MKSFYMWKGLKVIAMICVAVIVFGFVTMQLWNWLVPAIFGLRAITFGQALGLVVLSKILFGGFHRHSGRGRGWRPQMQERWAQMSPEERERFRSGWGGRRGCRPGAAASEAVSGQG